MNESLKADFERIGGDWELLEDKSGFSRRMLIFDASNRGWRLGEAVIDFAREYGFDAGDYTSADDEYYSETWDEAVDYLNKIAGPNYSFEQDDDFFAVEVRDFPPDTSILPMPAYWSSYLINDDASGLEPGEAAIADAYLEKNEIRSVDDAPGEAYFSRAYGSNGGTSQGGDLLDYLVRFWPQYASNYGFVITFRNGDESSAAHQGACDEDVSTLLESPYIAAQFEKIDPEDIRLDLKGYGAWDETELADDAQNRARILWLAAGDVCDRTA